MAGVMEPKSRIVGVGAYAPDTVITNHELERLVDTSDAWIRERTGIRERRIAEDGEATSDMAYQASTRALDAAGIEASDLDMIIVATVTPDMQLPATAAFLQRKLGAGMIPSFDIGAACAGFIYALAIGDQFIRSGTLRHVLVVGAELLTRVMNWQDRTTCVLFGDGAGAFVLGPAGGDGRGLLTAVMQTDASMTDSLCVPSGGSREPLTAASLAEQRNKVSMAGQEIFRVAVRHLTAASREAIEKAGLLPSQIDWVVPHQANLRILTQLSQRLEIPMDRFIVNIDRYGNTSSASVPLALDEGMKDGRIKPGDTILMCALGAGLSWASAVLRV
jgi:3-oxoacyl-[acyl-carrier-protein] synthase-3